MTIFTVIHPTMSNFPIIDVIIPAYNEEHSIGKVIGDIPKNLIRNIIVCNNNSSDNTAWIARHAGAMIVDQPEQGYGNACLKGIEFIRNQKSIVPPDIIVFIDGDYSDYPQEMNTLIEPIRNGHDLVIGSRILGGAPIGSLTIPQKFGNWLATRLIKIFYGFHFTDLGPFRAIRWNKLLQLDMQDRNFGWTVEMQIKAVKNQFACIEVPVSYRKRIGVSKISGTLKGSLSAGNKILWTIFKSL
ncbi:MAG: glycosyltransferase family 2 protein [Saprospiraceae bacterium]